MINDLKKEKKFRGSGNLKLIMKKEKNP